MLLHFLQSQVDVYIVHLGQISIRDNDIEERFEKSILLPKEEDLLYGGRHYAGHEIVCDLG